MIEDDRAGIFWPRCSSQRRHKFDDGAADEDELLAEAPTSFRPASRAFMSFGEAIGTRRPPTSQQVRRPQTPVTRQLVSTASMVDQVGTAIAKADGVTSKAILPLPKVGIGGAEAAGATD